ncbi:uncharacterized protein LOC127735058 [Mytilus californianus]|uniref:uncharacterized protein LOC127735058 n=1 Tax=Mytilus californianus TaxID=6549 RepID=UPI002247DC80|nr:uncharacterized protein LOC127735058 [Mytilus californianus]
MSPRSNNFGLDNDTFERVEKTGKELLANWKFLVEENEQAIETTFNKLQNMQPSKLSENRTRQEIEQHIDFYQADRHVMKKCMNHLKCSMKDRLNYLRKQKKFLLDYQNTIQNMYYSIEKSKRSRIPDPFPRFILDVKLNHYHMFNEELLISSNERAKKHGRRVIEPNTISIGNINVYMGRTGRANVMTPIHENEFESDKCLTGTCFDPYCTCCRSDSELSFENHELDIECKMYEAVEDSKRNENISRQEALTKVLQKQTQKTKIPIPVKLPSQLAFKKMKNMYTSSTQSTQLKLPPLLPNKKVKHMNESSSTQLKLPPLLPNKNMKYVEKSSSAPLKSPPILRSKKIKTCWEPLKLPPLLPGQKQNCKQEKSFTNRSVTPRMLQPLKMLPQNMKRSLIINKVKDDDKKEKSKVMSMKSRPKSAQQQTAETSDSNEIVNVGSEIALDTIRGNNVPRERNYRYSRLQNDSTKDCFIPKGPSDRVSKIIYERYLTLRKQIGNVRKQTEVETSDSYPESDQYHSKLDIEADAKYVVEDILDKEYDQLTTTGQSEGSAVNDFQDTTKQSRLSDCQVINIDSKREIKTRFLPMPPKTPKPKTLNSRLHQYNRKKI